MTDLEKLKKYFLMYGVTLSEWKGDTIRVLYLSDGVSHMCRDCKAFGLLDKRFYQYYLEGNFLQAYN